MRSRVRDLLRSRHRRSTDIAGRLERVEPLRPWPPPPPPPGSCPYCHDPAGDCRSNAEVFYEEREPDKAREVLRNCYLGRVAVSLERLNYVLESVSRSFQP